MTSATVKDMLCIHSSLQISSDTSGCQIHYHSNHICTINFALLLLQAFVAVKTGSSFFFGVFLKSNATTSNKKRAKECQHSQNTHLTILCWQTDHNDNIMTTSLWRCCLSYVWSYCFTVFMLGGGGSSSGKSIMPRKSESVFLCPEKGWKFFRIMTSSICERPVKETIFCSSVNPLGPRPATVLSQWNPMRREVTVSSDPGTQL